MKRLTSSVSRSPYFFMGCVGVSIFVIEVLVMFIFTILPKLPDIVEPFVDASLLSILVAPVLYHFLYRPLSLENQERRLVEQELRVTAEQLHHQREQLQEYSEQLESKVSDRTQELSIKNHQLEGLLAQLHQTQIQMIQSEKMSSLGHLVAGVAHEINNPVSFIHGNLSHVQSYIDDLLGLVNLYSNHYPNTTLEIEQHKAAIDLDFLRQDLPKLLQSMALGTNRISAIVLSLRNFSRLDEAEFKAVNLHEGIDSALLMLKHRLQNRSDHPEIKVTCDYGALPQIECYPSALNQVILNILANAIDALAKTGSSPGQIQIRTAVVDQSVEIAIADNGQGIPPSIQGQIFDPFFTTKAIGQGTGMGLAIAYQTITEQHGGQLDCDSTLGEGTTFRIRLPIQQCLKQQSAGIETNY
jgi:signal transduction histidine kinase